MKNIQKLIYVFLFSMLIVIGCKRESLNKNSKSSEQVAGDNKTSQRTIIYKATEAQIAAAKDAWLRDAQSKKGDTRAKGGCGQHISDFIFIYQITGSNCFSTSWDIDYIILSYDWVGSGYATTPVSATFTDMYSGSISGVTLVSANASLVDPSCSAWRYDGYCEMVRQYHYLLTSVPAPSSAWPADIGDFSLDLLSGFSNNCTPITVSGDLKGSPTLAEYAAAPALVTITPVGTGSIYITTECSIICPAPNVICPTGGLLTYWVLPNGSPQYANIQTNGNFVYTLSSGVPYGYSAVLNYTIGANSASSQPQTGTFTPN